MKKVLIILALGLSFFAASAVVQPTTVQASESTITSAPARETFEVHRRYDPDVDKIWHVGFAHGENYSGYLHYLRSYSTPNGTMAIYRGSLRRGLFAPNRVDEEY